MNEAGSFTALLGMTCNIRREFREDGHVSGQFRNGTNLCPSFCLICLYETSAIICFCAYFTPDCVSFRSGSILPVDS